MSIMPQPRKLLNLHRRSARRTTTAPPLSVALMTMFLRFFGLFSADHSSEERLENLVLRLNLSLLISWRLF